MATHNELGKIGEELAVNHLKELDYQIIETNWRYLKAEIDIIAIKDNWLVVIEVKTRTTDFFGTPEAFITTAKKRLLIKAADAYVQNNNIDLEVRFDVVGIIKNNHQTELKHIVNAFMAYE